MERKFDLSHIAASWGPHKLRDFVIFLVQIGNITGTQGEHILSKKTLQEQAEELLDIIPTRPYTDNQRKLIESVQQWKPLQPEPPQRTEVGYVGRCLY